MPTAATRAIAPIIASGLLACSDASPRVALAPAAPVPAAAPTTPVPGEDPLRSWNESATKASIVDFVRRVTTMGGSDFVSPVERIAVFDNDGTLWSERPVPFQLLFTLDRIKALAPEHPQWQTLEPFASVLRGDIAGVAASGERGVLALMSATHAGMPLDEFVETVTTWIGTARHPQAS